MTPAFASAVRAQELVERVEARLVALDAYEALWHLTRFSDAEVERLVWLEWEARC